MPKLRLLFVLGLSLALPWSGCEYIHQKEQIMRSLETDKLIGQAQKLTHTMQQQLQPNYTANDSDASSNSLYLFPLPEKIQLDGYHDDWGLEINNGTKYSNQLTTSQPLSQNLTVIAGQNKHYLYLFFQVIDDITIYARLQATDHSADHLELDIIQHPLEGHYFLQVTAPGQFEAFRTSHDQQGNTSIIYTSNIHGYWQDTVTGYNVELRIPRPGPETRLGFSVFDYVNSAANEITLIGQYGNQTSDLTSTAILIKRSPVLQNLLELSPVTASRVYVLNPYGWILASKHNPARNVSAQRSRLNQTLFDILNQVYMFISNLRDPPAPAVSSSISRIDGQTIQAAARNTTATSWYKQQGSNQAVISIAYPVKDSSGAVVAIIVIEQNSSNFLSLQNPDFLRNIAYSLFMIIILSLLIFIYTWKLARQLMTSKSTK